jgi:C4-type Zn-finger protein
MYKDIPKSKMATLICKVCGKIKWVKLLIIPYNSNIPNTWWVCVTCGNIVSNNVVPIGLEPYNRHDIVSITINGNTIYHSLVHNPHNKFQEPYIDFNKNKQPKSNLESKTGV